MRATEHRTHRPRRAFVRLPAVRGYELDAKPEPAVVQAAGLGLTAVELEDLLVAVGDLEDRAGSDQRARLARGRAALERELARTMTA